MEDSGIQLNIRAITYLENNGWEVKISPYYRDIATGTSREVDLIATKEFLVQDDGKALAAIVFKLYIECKYIDKKTSFWFHPTDKNIVREVLNRTGFDPKDIHNHRYNSTTEVAKLFATEKKSHEKEPIYQGLNQALHSLIYYGAFPRNYGNPSIDAYFIDYPVILCNSFNNFERADLDNHDSCKKRKIALSHFPLQVAYAYKDPKSDLNINNNYLIEVVNFEKIADFVRELEEDQRTFRNFIYFNKRMS